MPTPAQIVNAGQGLSGYSAWENNPHKPVRPEFQSILGKDGYLRQPFQAQAHQANAFTVSTDMNPWLKLQDQRINQQQAGMRDQLNRDVNLGLGTGMSNLAASGGIDQGARERMMMNSAAQRTQGLSGIGQQSAMDRTNTNIQAQMMGQDAQRFNAAARNQNSMFNAGALNQNSMFNAGNAIGGVGNQNQFNAANYAQDMSAWGAKMTADAQARMANQEDPGLLGMGGALGTGLGGRGGLLGTGLFRKDSGGNYKVW